MASGRQDYSVKVVPTRVSIPLEQQYWYQDKGGFIAPGASPYLINYTVPVSYKLVITGGVISCQLPGINYFRLYIAGVTLKAVYFDSSFIFPSDSAGIFTLKAGEVFKTDIWNNDTVSTNFLTTFWGYLEKV